MPHWLCNSHHWHLFHHQHLSALHVMQRNLWVNLLLVLFFILPLWAGEDKEDLRPDYDFSASLFATAASTLDGDTQGGGGAEFLATVWKPWQMGLRAERVSFDFPDVSPARRVNATLISLILAKANFLWNKGDKGPLMGIFSEVGPFYSAGQGRTSSDFKLRKGGFFWSLGFEWFWERQGVTVRGTVYEWGGQARLSATGKRQSLQFNVGELAVGWVYRFGGS